MSTKRVVRLNIVRGTNSPSKWDLAAALMDGYAQHARTVSFWYQQEDGGAQSLPGLSDHGTIEVMITAIQAEDGSGESWNIEGSSVGNDATAPSYSFRGYYRTNGVTGNLMLAVD